MTVCMYVYRQWKPCWCGVISKLIKYINRVTDFNLVIARSFYQLAYNAAQGYMAPLAYITPSLLRCSVVMLVSLWTPNPAL